MLTLDLCCNNPFTGDFAHILRALVVAWPDDGPRMIWEAPLVAGYLDGVSLEVTSTGFDVEEAHYEAWDWRDHVGNFAWSQCQIHEAGCRRLVEQLQALGWSCTEWEDGVPWVDLVERADAAPNAVSQRSTL